MVCLTIPIDKGCTYIGHDFGAILGTIVASNHPEKIDKLVLINGCTPDVLQKAILADKDQAARLAYANRIVENTNILTRDDFAFLKILSF